MKHSTSKIILILVGAVVVFLTGAYSYYLFQEPEPKAEMKKCVTPEPILKKYSSEKYSFQYPQYPKEYSVSETGEGRTHILTVSKNETTKLEIFKADEYPGDRAAFGFTGHENPDEAQEYAQGVQARNPREYLTVGEGENKFDVWLYYRKGDEESKKELKEIFETIKVH